MHSSAEYSFINQTTKSGWAPRNAVGWKMHFTVMSSTADKAKLGFQTATSSVGHLCQDPQQLNGCLQVSVAHHTLHRDSHLGASRTKLQAEYNSCPGPGRYNNVLGSLLILKQNCEHMQ